MSTIKRGKGGGGVLLPLRLLHANVVMASQCSQEKCVCPLHPMVQWKGSVKPKIARLSAFTASLNYVLTFPKRREIAYYYRSL